MTVDTTATFAAIFFTYFTVVVECLYCHYLLGAFAYFLSCCYSCYCDFAIYLVQLSYKNDYSCFNYLYYYYHHYYWLCLVSLKTSIPPLHRLLHQHYEYFEFSILIYLMRLYWYLSFIYLRYFNVYHYSESFKLIT